MSKVKIQGNASGTGVLTVEAPNTNTDRTITLPDETGDVVVNTATGIDVTGSVTCDGASSSKAVIVEGSLAVTPSGAASVFSKSGNETRIRSYGATTGTGYTTFRTGGGGGSTDSEAMRIDSGGRLLLNTTSHLYTTDVPFNVISTGNYPAVFKRSDLDGSMRNMLGFMNASGAFAGNIKCTSSATQYNTSSDYRLKEDDQPMSASIDRLKQLRPINFTWKADGSRVDGFFAHEAQAVVPEAVSGEKDAMRIADITDEDGNVTGTQEVPDYQGIDQSKLVPLLTSALQEAVAKIEALETRVTQLENA